MATNSITRKKYVSTKSNKASAKEMSPAKEYTISILKGFAVGALALLIVLSIFSLIMVKFDYSEKSVPFMTIIASIIASYIGGYRSAKSIKKNGLVVGMITSIPLAIFVLILAVIANSGNLNFIAAIAIILMIVFGAIGGIMSVNKSPRRRK